MKKFGLCDRIYQHNEINEVIENFICGNELVKNKKENCFVFNVPCAFDIETTSFRNENNEKCACMYIWQIGLNGAVVIGRTWDELIETFKTISKKLQLNKNKRLIFYVHNLSFEFQFIGKRFNWIKTFSLENRKVVDALSDLGIEFKCSYALSGLSLSKMGEELVKYNVKKMCGDLDYSLKRNDKTKLTEAELNYCVNDVKVVMAYIQEKIEKDGSIEKIPMTKTSYVRNRVRDNCIHSNKSHVKDKKFQKHSDIMKQLTIDTEEYEQLKRAFCGGFTHASPLHAGIVMSNVTSYDFTSSYPTVMIAEQFPMSKGRLVKIKRTEEIEEYLNTYCCVFDVRFKKIKSKFIFENYISQSKCVKCKNAVTNNGRIYSADELITTITNVDFEIIKRIYEWDDMNVANFRIYLKGYLPTDFVKTIVDLYKDKTELKGVEGKEFEYQCSKADLNSLYGMIATDISRDSFSFENGEWKSEKANVKKQIEKYNKDKKRCLFYVWAVFCTAYARRNLWTGIIECGSDYIYSDTDSVKITNAENHRAYFEKYNNYILKKISIACEFHGIEPEKIKPKTKNGIEKPIGVWDYDGNYEKFKTLGAKRYLVKYSEDEKNGSKKGKTILTVSGLNKDTAIDFLVDKYGDNVFDQFKNGMFVDDEHTGKNVHTYIDEKREGTLTDYQGNVSEYCELSSVYLEGSEYKLGISEEYINFISFIGGAF